MTMTLLLALAFQASLDQDYRDHNCADPQNQADMNICELISFQRADNELNRVWPSLIASARDADRELNREFDQRPTNESILRAAQRAWLTYREQHCTYAGMAEARGGSMEAMVYHGCRAQLTRARIRELTGEGEPAQ